MHLTRYIYSGILSLLLSGCGKTPLNKFAGTYKASGEMKCIAPIPGCSPNYSYNNETVEVRPTTGSSISVIAPWGTQTLDYDGGNDSTYNFSSNYSTINNLVKFFKADIDSIYVLRYHRAGPATGEIYYLYGRKIH